MIGDEELVRRWFPQKFTPEERAKFEMVSAKIGGVAGYLDEILPDCREKSLAITKLEEATFWATAALVRPAAGPAREPTTHRPES